MLPPLRSIHPAPPNRVEQPPGGGKRTPPPTNLGTSMATDNPAAQGDQFLINSFKPWSNPAPCMPQGHILRVWAVIVRGDLPPPRPKRSRHPGKGAAPGQIFRLRTQAHQSSALYIQPVGENRNTISRSFESWQIIGNDYRE